jgi:hypothetical protein
MTSNISNEIVKVRNTSKKDTSLLGKSPVLLVIDVQHEFLDSNGAVPCPATSVEFSSRGRVPAHQQRTRARGINC